VDVSEKITQINDNGGMRSVADRRKYGSIAHLSEDPVRIAEVASTEERDKNLGVKRL
jgi:hypothetical protein